MDTGRFSERPADRKRAPLMRSADGRLRPDTGDHEIGDVWAQQRRLQLAEELEEKRKQAELRRLRRERGLIGLTKLYVDKALFRIRTELFGTASTAKKPEPKPSSRTKPDPATGKSPALRSSVFARQPAAAPPASNTKTIEIKLAVPEISGLAWRKRLFKLSYTFKRWFARLPRQAVIGTAVVSVALVGGGIFLSMQGGPAKPDHKAGAPETKKAAAAVTNKQAALQPGTPKYQTLTPNGRDVSEFGGWKRISPPDKDPVYAYADKLAGINIAVSQQPLPADFKRDTDNKVAELAKNFSANDTLNAGNTTVYLGTSAKGPQSIIFNKDGLLILIKSDSVIKDSDWTKYVSSLQE